MHHDLVLHGGEVFDPATGTRTRTDIGIRDGKIATIAPNLDRAEAAAAFDLTGKTAYPGWIDFHTHIYWGGTPLGVNPDVLAPQAGVTTWVDAGSAGAGNVEGFVRHVVEPATVAVRFFVHVSYIGLLPVGQTDLRFGELFDYRLADAHACLRAIEAYPDRVAGIKVRLGHMSTGPHGMDSLRIARNLGDVTGLPIMVHISDPPPTLGDVLPYLGAGDIVTHCHTPGLMGILDRHGRVRDDVREAQQAGVLFDVGHGAGSFSFSVAERALADGFLPDIISSDLHAYNVDGPAFGLTTTLEKFLALGLTLDQVMERCTIAPARALREEERGSLSVGRSADITVAHLEDASVVLGDAHGNIREHSQALVVDGTIIGGEVLPPHEGPSQGKRKPGLKPVDPRLTRPRMGGMQ